MADKNQYQALLRAKVISAVEHARAAAGLTHQGVKGTVLEILVGQLFRPLLPSDIGIGTGQIVESYTGRLSGQVDIILYDRSILPPVLLDDKVGVFPIESVLYAIEVKTTLNASELTQAHESAKDLQLNFGYLPGQRKEGKVVEQHQIEKVRSVLFALKTDLSGNNLNEGERYKRLYKEETAYLRAICVAGREYWYDNGTHWVGGFDCDQYDGVLAFIGGITNTYRTVAASRGHPLLGNYIVPSEVMTFASLPSGTAPILRGICTTCGLEGDITPDVPPIELTVNGAIHVPCPHCDGKVASEPAQYKFSAGKLVSIAPLEAK
ncbi:DUF6602 domain-containing protein [Ralstonia soli]|uniref:DUF6602 domain-containing protein n=1 Tax=Ralstonia soli TaxID=2953896 RepID=A0ABT1AJF1_9RALS|nr:DUF6602 domain-containing protein [Ralstonia soli]MCO5398418.1 hypothetical protein [Ralstonia soli]